MVTGQRGFSADHKIYLIFIDLVATYTYQAWFTQYDPTKGLHKDEHGRCKHGRRMEGKDSRRSQHFGIKMHSRELVQANGLQVINILPRGRNRFSWYIASQCGHHLVFTLYYH